MWPFTHKHPVYEPQTKLYRTFRHWRWQLHIEPPVFIPEIWSAELLEVLETHRRLMEDALNAGPRR